MKTVILTGFTPFDGESINPSFEAIQLVESDEYQLIKLRIPTTFEHSIEIIKDSMMKHKPDLILMVGQAGGRQGISLERFAVNLDDSDICDNEGIMKHESKIVLDGPIAYQTNLNLKSILRDLMQQGIPSKISNTAGTYVCNHIMYGIYHAIEKEKLHSKALFVHVPYAHEQVKNKPDTFSMSIEEIANAIHIIIDSILS